MPDHLPCYPAKAVFGRRMAALVLLTTAGLLSLSFFIMSARSLRDSGTIWVEGPMIGVMDAIGKGRLYQLEAIKHPPYTVLTHTPLSYWVSYPLYRLNPGFQSLRAVNLAFTALCALVIGLIVRRTEKHWAAAVFAGLVFLLAPPVFLWSQIARSPDSLATLLTLAAILAWLRVRPGLKRDVLLAALFAAAVFSKQTALGVMGALVGLCYLHDRDLWGAARWLLLSGCGLGALFVALQTTTHGGFFWNVTVANLLPMDYAQWRVLVTVELRPLWLLILVVIAAGARPPKPVWFYFWAACIFGLLLIAKPGADTNYFFDACAATAIMAGSAFSRLRAAGPARRWFAAVSLAAALCAVTRYGDCPWLRINSPALSSEYASLVGRLRQAGCLERAMLSEDAELNVRLGSAPVWNDPFIFGALAKLGRWQSGAIMSAVSTQSYCAVVLRDERYLPPPLMTLIATQYFEAGAFRGPVGDYRVFLPK